MQAIKDHWQRIRLNLQEKVNFVNSINVKHKGEVELYLKFSDYMDTKKLDDKMKVNLGDMDKKMGLLMNPVNALS